MVAAVFLLILNKHPMMARIFPEFSTYVAESELSSTSLPLY